MTMKNFITSLLLFGLLALLLGIAVLGVRLPSDPPARSLGIMQVAAFPNGLSLFQPTRGVYYTISPFNDYYMTSQGYRVSYITLDELDNQSYTNTYGAPLFKRIFDSFTNYYSQFEPTITFISHVKATYTATTHTNTLIIKKTLKTTNPTIAKIGSTFSYHNENYLFDRSGTLYDYKTPDQIQAFERLYAFPLNVGDGLLRKVVPSKTVFIIHPKHTGVIVIKANPHQLLLINRDAKLIEVEEVVVEGQELYTSEFDIRIYDSLEEALEAV